MQSDPRTRTQTAETTRYPQNPANLINLSKYPLSRLGSPEGARLIADSHERLMETGVCLLKEFVKPVALQSMSEEARTVEPDAYFRRHSHSAYLEPDDDAFPPDHPRRVRMATSGGSIAYDRLPEGSALKSLYQWDPLVSFMGAVLGNRKLYRYADPLGALSINVLRSGDRHAWHFDESEFSTSLMLQAADAGGDFEYVPNTDARDEAGYALVGRILREEHNDVRQLPCAPGDLLIFSGRASIHRVTEVKGDTSRLVAMLCFSTRPNEIDSDQVRRQLWGRTQ